MGPAGGELAVAAGARREAVRQMDATLRALALLEAAAAGLGRARAAEAALARAAGALEAAVGAMDWPGCSPTRLGARARWAPAGAGGAEAEPPHPDEARVVGMVRALAEVREACELESRSLRAELDREAAGRREARARAASLEERASRAEDRARVCEEALAEGLERRSAAESLAARLTAELEEARRPGPAVRDASATADMDCERLAELEATVARQESALRAGRDREAGLALAARAARTEREAATAAEKRALALAERCRELEQELSDRPLKGPGGPSPAACRRRPKTGSPAGAGAPLRPVGNILARPAAPDPCRPCAPAAR